MNTLIEWWPGREPEPDHVAAILAGLRKYRYFRGCALSIRTDDSESPGTAIVSGTRAFDVSPTEFLRMVEDVRYDL